MVCYLVRIGLNHRLGNGYVTGRGTTGETFISGNTDLFTATITGASSYLSQNVGALYFFNAPSVSAGATPTFTQQFIIASTGEATFSSSVTAATAINVTGNGGFFNAANKFGLDHFAGASRFYSSGSNSSTKGGYEFHTNSSDGSLDVIALGIASTGAATFSSSVGVSVTPAAVSKLQVNVASNVSFSIRNAVDVSGAAVIQGITDIADENIPLEYRASKHCFMQGNVGIGTTNPPEKLQIGGNLNFYTGDGDKKIYFRSNGAVADTNWQMGTYNSPTGATVVTAVATTIDVYGSGGNTFGFMVRNTLNQPLLQIGGGTGAATFSSTVETTGIKFPATQVASADANTLDDYEEGTWSPNVDPQTGSYVMIFGSKGTYTKIGRVVTVQYYFRVVNKGTGSGSCILSNLPFASLTTSTDDSYTGTGIRQGNYLNTLVINQNSSSINITENTGDPIVQGQWNAGSITYFT
jgi:hypothetical protein